jgi:hypothetical protein
VKSDLLIFDPQLDHSLILFYFEKVFVLFLLTPVGEIEEELKPSSGMEIVNGWLRPIIH